MPSTIRLHRVLKAPADRVYRAFTDADAWCRYLPPHGFLGKIDLFEPKVGGKFHMSFRNFTTNEEHAFGGQFIEMEPNRKLVYTDYFDDPNLPGELTVTIEFTEVPGGTDIKIVQTGVPDIIPESMCYLGWQDTLTQLRDLVEPEIRQG
ncbi:MAG: SRPBCC family protein [Mesorhizobium sp.]